MIVGDSVGILYSNVFFGERAEVGSLGVLFSLIFLINSVLCRVEL